MNLLFERVKIQCIVERLTTSMDSDAVAVFVADAVARQLAMTEQRRLRDQAKGKNTACLDTN